MNRLRRGWNTWWIDALIVLMLFGAVAAIAMLGFAWSTSP